MKVRVLNRPDNYSFAVEYKIEEKWKFYNWFTFRSQALKVAKDIEENGSVEEVIYETKEE